MSSTEDQQADEQRTGGARVIRPWLDVVLAPQLDACRGVQQLLADTRVRVNDISECIACDPVLVIELLRTANNVSNSTTQRVSSLRQAVTSLGVNTIGEIIQLTKARPQISNQELSEQFEFCRERALNIAGVATVIAMQAAREWIDACATAGLLSTVGELVIIAFLKERYLQVSRQYTRRSQIIYRLVKDFQLNPDLIRVEYLRQKGIPQEVYGAFLEDGNTGSDSAAAVRLIVNCAIEIVDAFEAEKLPNYEPGKKIPPKSSIRMLQLSDAQYAALYAKIVGYFQSGEVVDDSPEEEEESIAEVPSAEPQVAQFVVEPDIFPAPMDIAVDDEALTPVLVVDSEPGDEEDVPQISKIESAVEAIVGVLDGAESKDDVIGLILQTLIENGHFARTAILAINREKKEAVTIAACGANIDGMTSLAIRDPLSPLLQSLSKVQSCGKLGQGNSPFGSPTFALAPIDAGSKNPVVLYADCGHGEKIGLAARRIFRHVIQRLNQVLPNLPGTFGE